MKKKPLLSHVEELELCKAAQAGDKKAFDTMVTRNLGLVSKIAKKLYYNNEQYSYEDLFQEGVFGLIKAIHKFDPQEGCRFSTYSYYWIYCFVSRYNANHQGKIRVPIHVKEKIRKLNKENNQDQLLNEKSKIPVVMSLNATYGDKSSLEEMTSYLVMDNTIDELDVVKDQMKNVLTEREYSVLCHRYGVDGQQAKTQRECAKLYDLSYAAISLIERKAISKLRVHFGEAE
jgi:RNA polymerase primary sigma factor